MFLVSKGIVEVLLFEPIGNFKGSLVPLNEPGCNVILSHRLLHGIHKLCTDNVPEEVSIIGGIVVLLLAERAH